MPTVIVLSLSKLICRLFQLFLSTMNHYQNMLGHQVYRLWMMEMVICPIFMVCFWKNTRILNSVASTVVKLQWNLPIHSFSTYYEPNHRQSYVLRLLMTNSSFFSNFIMRLHIPDVPTCFGNDSWSKESSKIVLKYILLRYTTVGTTKIENRDYFKKTSTKIGQIGLCGTLGVGNGQG